MSSVLVAAPPRDTPFFDKRTGRVSEQWLNWFGSITSTATIVQTLQTLNTIAEDNSTDGNSSEILNQVIDLVSLLAEPRRAPEPPAVDLLPALDAPVHAWCAEADELRGMIAAGLEENQAWRAEADELRALVAAGDPAPFGALGSAAFQPATAFDPAGAWSSWTGAVNANSNDLSNVYILGTAGLQVSAFATIGGSLNYTDGAATYMTSNNAGSGAWNEFSYYLDRGAALANDAFWIAVNARTALGGSDSYAPALQIAALTGDVTLPNQTTVNGALLGTFGGWQSWTPTISGGSMSVSSPTINDAQYIRVGPVIYFKFWVSSMTLGGTAAGAINVSLPAALVGEPSAVTTFYTNGSASGFTAGVGYTNGSNLQCFINGSGNWTLGSAQVLCEGFYRCA